MRVSEKASATRFVPKLTCGRLPARTSPCLLYTFGSSLARNVPSPRLAPRFSRTGNGLNRTTVARSVPIPTGPQ